MVEPDESILRVEKKLANAWLGDPHVRVQNYGKPGHSNSVKE